MNENIYVNKCDIDKCDIYSCDIRKCDIDKCDISNTDINHCDISFDSIDITEDTTISYRYDKCKYGGYNEENTWNFNDIIKFFLNFKQDISEIKGDIQNIKKDIEELKNISTKT